MPDKFKQALNLSVGIPVWGVITFLAGFIFQAGATLTKLNLLIESHADTKREVAIIKEKQIERGSMINSLQANSQNHESRITNLERNAIERGR